MDAKLKALKVVELKDILTKANVPFQSRANKADLIGKIIANPAAVQTYESSQRPDAQTAPVAQPQPIAPEHSSVATRERPHKRAKKDPEQDVVMQVAEPALSESNTLAVVNQGVDTVSLPLKGVDVFASPPTKGVGSVAHVASPVATVEPAEEEEVDASREPVGESRTSDLYLDTINRAILDFDFEKVCSVSLSNINIYGCLVCGKYFQGRGRKSYAYAHSIHDDHHVFINLESTKVYVLPDSYLVSDPSLEDISFVLSPIFTPRSISTLSSPQHLMKPSYDLSSKAYVPGYIGLNNIKRNDHMNVIIHALIHIPTLRDFLLLSNFRGKESELVKRFAVLAKKIWNPRLFKSQVSPHEFLQEVNRASAGKFRLEQQGDPVEFLGWLLNRIHKDLGGTKKKNSSIIFATFQGELRMENQQVLVRPDAGENEKPRFDIDREIKSTVSPFLFLAVDLPPPPLFQDSVEKNIIPQVSIYSVLAKYDGQSTQEFLGQLRRYKCQRLPQYIILHFKRFTKNVFVEEKNPTIVTFPLRGLDFRDYLDAPPSHPSTVYDLIANVTHESVAGTTRDKEHTVWKVHLRAASGGGEGEKWFQIQDLIVEETRKEMIFLGETVLQIWERRAMAQNVGSSNANRMDVDK